jgi:hypothetical protein
MLNGPDLVADGFFVPRLRRPRLKPRVYRKRDTGMTPREDYESRLQESS